MTKLPVIVGFGGMNAAGRSSGFHSYKRMVCEVLSNDQMASTWQDLAHRMGLRPDDVEAIQQGTLVRRIERFDPDAVLAHLKARLDPDLAPASFVMKQSKLPEQFVDAEQRELPDQEVCVSVSGPLDVLLTDKVPLGVSSAGGLPRGFDPSALYNSHHHPRGLSLAIYAASDALNSLGLEWEEVLKVIKPDEVAVYGGSALSQIDEHSLAGIVGNPLRGQRINS